MVKKISLLLIIVFLIMLGLITSRFFTVASTFNFVGFIFNDLGNAQITGGCAYSSSSDVNVDGHGFLTISGNTADGTFKREVKTEITNIDEILVLYEGFGKADCSNGGSGSSFTIYGNVIDDSGNSVGASKSISTSKCPSGSDSVSAPFQFSVWKFKNNFDGTWSYLEAKGYDVYLEKQTAPISTAKQYLVLGVGGGGGCRQGEDAVGYLTVYNIGRKSNAFIQCKANQYVTGYDKNNNVVCKDFPSIVLNSEEFVKESDFEKQQRLIEELTAKNNGLNNQIIDLQNKIQQSPSQQQVTTLQQQIDTLQSQLTSAQDKSELQTQINNLRQQQLKSSNLQDQISALRVELKNTKAILADVQANDKSVINVITVQEKFQRPNPFIEFINSIIAWIKSLFN